MAEETSQSLRERAEQRLQAVSPNPLSLDGEDLHRLVQELQVHQVELELQNEELRAAQQSLEISRDRYSLLFNKAPVGFLALDEYGMVINTNETFLRMLGMETDQVTGHPFVEWIVPPEQAVFRGRFKAVFRQPSGKQIEAQLTRSDRSTFFARLECAALAPSYLMSQTESRQLLLVSVSDITELKEAEEALRFMATHDSLTGLYNRSFFDVELERIQQSRDFPVSLIVMDLDDLKRTNDRFGHVAGDQMLRQAGNLLKGSLRRGDLASRIGGDEFAVLLPNTSDIEVERIVSRLRKYMTDGNAPSFSMGYSTAHEPSSVLDALRAADDAMYTEKSNHKQ